MMRYKMILVVGWIVFWAGLTKAQSQKFFETISFSDICSGYDSTISGPVSHFHSDDPRVNDALIARCSDKENSISWQTSQVPADYDNRYIYFVWHAGLATGKNRKNSSFDLFVNDRKILRFHVIKQHFPQHWVLQGSNGMALGFVQDLVDDNEDCFGQMYLKVPVTEDEKGKRLKITVQGINTQRYDDWYMAFQHVEKESALVVPRPVLKAGSNEPQQLIDVDVSHVLPQAQKATIQLGQGAYKEVMLHTGYNHVECWVPAVRDTTMLPVTVHMPGVDTWRQDIPLKPVAVRKVYLIPCSHTDIGYSNLQTVVAKQHTDYIKAAMNIIEKSRGYPEQARFKWNIESLWSVHNFMEDASRGEKERFLDDVKKGDIGLSAGFINLLTGVCRPEELIHWTDYADSVKQQYGINLNSLMMSDVPGMSWNVVSALAQRGIRYVSDGPNYIPHEGFPDMGGRVGATHRSWGDKPFYWVSPSGTDTILFWQAGKGYSWFQDWNVGRFGTVKSRDSLLNYIDELEKDHYPYEMVQLRYSIINDNQGPDPDLPAFVDQWNKKYLSPQLVISTVDTMMSKFEHRYAGQLPVESGDFTPYWEDGVMSTAKEETLVKHSVERVYQSEVLNSLFFPHGYNVDDYSKVWRNIIMWHEHTWGAWNSISQPDDSFATKEWIYKRDFALAADSQSRRLLNKAIRADDDYSDGFNVLNTSSWQRTGLVILTASQSSAGDMIVDQNGMTYPSQRLSNGKLAFLAKDIPALGSKKFYNKKGASPYTSSLRIHGHTIENDHVRLVLDDKTGAIKSLVDKESNKEFVDTSVYAGLNQYLYVPGKDPAVAVSTHDVSVSIKDKGPLLATFTISSAPAGTKELVQEVSLVNEIDKVCIIDSIDKTKVREKESVHFAFPVNVPDGQMRVDLGTTGMRPEKDQLRGANKDYFCLQRWADVSDKKLGMTLTVREVPLVEEGALVNEAPYATSQSFGGESGEKKWKEHATVSNTFFSYVMNNYWYTNYKADQQGKVAFHYALYLHRRFDLSEAARKGTEDCQPLLVTARQISRLLPFELDDKHILLTSVKPANSGDGLILRLVNVSSRTQQLQLRLPKDKNPEIYVSNASEEKLKRFNLKEDWLLFEIKTLYVE